MPACSNGWTRDEYLDRWLTRRCSGGKGSAGGVSLPSLLRMTIAILVVVLAHAATAVPTEDRNKIEQKNTTLIKNVVGYLMEPEDVLGYVQHHTINMELSTFDEENHSRDSFPEAVLDCQSDEEGSCEGSRLMLQAEAILEADLCQLGLTDSKDLQCPAPPDEMARPYLGLYGLYRMVMAVANIGDHEGFSGNKSWPTPRPLARGMIVPDTQPTEEAYAELSSILRRGRAAASNKTGGRANDLPSGETPPISDPSVTNFTRRLVEWVHEVLEPQRRVHPLKRTPWNSNVTLVDWLNDALQWKIQSTNSTLSKLQSKAEGLIDKVKEAPGPFGWLPMYLVQQLITDHLMLKMLPLLTKLETKARLCQGREGEESHAGTRCYFAAQSVALNWAWIGLHASRHAKWLSQSIPQALNQTMQRAMPLSLSNQSQCRRSQSDGNDGPLMGWNGTTYRYTAPDRIDEVGWVTLRCPMEEREPCRLDNENEGTYLEQCQALLKKREDQYDNAFRGQLDTVYHHLINPYLELLETLKAMAEGMSQAQARKKDRNEIKNHSEAPF